MKKQIISSIIIVLSTFFSSNSFAIQKSDIENLEYSLVAWGSDDKFEKTIKLKNGKFEYQGPQGVMDRESVILLKSYIGDINDDSISDAAVILSHNTGGSGSVIQVAAVIDQGGKLKHVASRNLGDRTDIKSIKIEKNIIVIDIANERFYPGESKIVRYQLKNNKLVGQKPFKQL